MIKNRRLFKKTIFFLFCVCIVYYHFLDYKMWRLRDHFDFMAHIDDENNLTHAYFINTPGCRMPYFEVIDDNIAHFVYEPDPVQCVNPLIRTSDVIPGQLQLNLNVSEQLSIYNIKDLSSIRCKYAELRRQTDSRNEYLKNVPFKLAKTMQLPKDLEFITVECYSPTGTLIYKDFHFFALEKPKKKLKKSAKKSSFYNRVSFNDTDAQDRISVMVLGIDSVSHLNFQRQMRRTASYIKQNLSHVEFWGFNKVGDNTFPNLVPLLSGLDDQELNISCTAPLARPSYDGCSFIWKRYKQAGYKTVFAEDVAEIGMFNYCRNGFRRTPTDYYLRPVLLEMEKHIAYERRGNVNVCMGGRRTADVLIEYMRKLIPHMQRELFFSFFWSNALTHDRFNMPIFLDEQLALHLELLQKQGILNRTLVLLMSDHGMRWGSFRNTYQGMMEERQPLLIALYPAWLRQRYPLAVANLETNAKRLTTPFDIHATLLHLLDMHNLEANQLQRSAADLKDIGAKLPRGISLFLPMPVQRNCGQAGIAAHWCTCHQREKLPTNDVRVRRAARYLIRIINERLVGHPKCQKLTLNSILQAFIAAPDKKIVKEINNDYPWDLLVQIETIPGMGLFESTIRMSNSAIALTGTISRINLYGNDSFCINDAALKLFCYCQW